MPEVDVTEEAGIAVGPNVAVQSLDLTIHVAGGMADEYGSVIISPAYIIFFKSRFGLYCCRSSKDCRPISLAILPITSPNSTIRTPFKGVGQVDGLDDAGTPRTNGKNEPKQ